jgi:uncharacterized membrane protein YgcG
MRLRREDRQTVARAVDAAEEATGLQICVYLGPVEEDARTHAERMFVAAGLHTRPAVLLLVAPSRRRVEIVTAPDARIRLDDAAAARCIGEMTPRLAAGDLAGGIVAGVERLVSEAGPGTPPEGGQEFPDLLEG